jgi:hypothetical protein
MRFPSLGIAFLLTLQKVQEGDRNHPVQLSIENFQRLPLILLTG